MKGIGTMTRQRSLTASLVCLVALSATAQASRPAQAPEVSGSPVSAAAQASLTDGEIWNEGLSLHEAGDVTNALRVLRPLMLSKTHGARAAEVVAKLEYDRGNLEESARAAQIALRAAPADPRANRNFTRAVDGLPQVRETKRVNDVLQRTRGQSPDGMLLASTQAARRLMSAAGSFRTNAPARAVALADALARQCEAISDTWIPVREAIAQSVTNEEQAATILEQVSQAQAKTRKAAKELGDLDAGSYGTMSDVEHDFTRFLKLTALPPTAIGEDAIAQSNAWLDVEQFNGRSWQSDALDYTRAFRAKFPAWARAYEQQAAADTNKPPFTAEDQAKVSALATELEKLQLECCEKSLPPSQEKALDLIRQIRELLPKDGSGGQGQQNQQQNQKDQQQNQQNQQQDQQKGESEQKQEQDPGQQEQEEKEQAGDEKDEKEEDQELEATLKKAQERADEHEAEKKARMRKRPLPPNERDW